MRTDDLINALAEDHAARPRLGSLRQTFFAAVALGLAIAAIAFALTLGIRPDIALAMQTWRFDFKLVMTVTLAVTSARLVWRLSRPAVDARPAEMAMAIAPVLLLGAVTYELWSIPEPEWLPRAIGSNSIACLLSISFLSLAPPRRRVLRASPRRAAKARFRGRRPQGCSPARLQPCSTRFTARTTRLCSARSGIRPP